MGGESRARLLRFKQKEGIMREIDLTPYAIKIPRMVNGSVIINEETYDVKESVIAMLFMKGAQTKSRDSIRWGKLAERIEVAEGSYLFEEAEYAKLLQGAEQVVDPGRNDLEFLRRIFDAPEVQVTKEKAPPTEVAQ